MTSSFFLCLTADEIGFPLLDPYDSFRIDGNPRSSTPICVTNLSCRNRYALSRLHKKRSISNKQRTKSTKERLTNH